MNLRLARKLFAVTFMALAPVSLHGSMISPPSLCSTDIQSPELRTGSEISLSLRCGFYAPINIEYFLPLNIEIVSLTGDGAPSIIKSETGNILKWELPANSGGNIILRFKILKPDFYKLYGRIRMGSIDPNLLREYMLKEVDRLPAFSGTDERTKLYRKQYLSRPDQVIKGFQGYASSQYAFEDDFYCIRVSENSGRIETWDFSTLSKRSSHYIRSKLGYHQENLTRPLLMLTIVGIIVVGIMALGVCFIKAFHEKPDALRIILLVIGLFLLIAPILYFGAAVKKYFPGLFSHMQ